MAGFIDYARQLECLILSAEAAFDREDVDTMLDHFARAAQMVHDRDLCGEITAIQLDLDIGGRRRCARRGG